MVGTLTVQNLQGPTSGANANKVIIPSGQTIDASAGLFTPSASQIVQHKHHYFTVATSHTSSSFTAAHSPMTFTAKHSNSLLRIHVELNVSIDQIVNSTTIGMIWSVFKDGSNLVSDGQNAIGFYYMDGGAHNNSHINQTSELYINAGDTSSHSYQVYTRNSHGTGRVKSDTGWNVPHISIMEIKQ